MTWLAQEGARGVSGLGLGELGTFVAAMAAAIATVYGLRKGRQSKQVLTQAKIVISTELAEARSLVNDLQVDNERIRARLREVEEKYDKLNDRVWRAVEIEAQNEQLTNTSALLKSTSALLKAENSRLKAENLKLRAGRSPAAKSRRERSTPSPKRTGAPGEPGRSSRR